jgi:putative membrane protein
VILKARVYARALNPQVCLECVCCAGFAALMLYLARSGKYLSYVTPRMEPYLYFTALVMLLWAGANALRLFRREGRVRVAHCLVPAVPILLLLLPHSPLSAADLSYDYAGGGAFAGASAEFPAQGAAGLNPAAGAPGLDTGVSADAPALIEVEADAFYAWLNELYVNLDSYVGCRISVTGFVFKDEETLGADEFVPARLGMTCCVADLIPYGFVCKYDRADELESDTWVRVEGIVQKGLYEGLAEPQIAVTSVEPAAAVEGYIYPFAY